MPLNSEARLLSNDFLAAGLLEAFPSRMQFLTVLPFYPIHGNSLNYVVTPELSPGVPLGFCDPIAEHTKLPEDPVRSFVMAELAAHWEVSYKSQDVFGETNDQFRVQMGLAVRQLLYRFGEQFEVGDSVADPNTFDGLEKLVDPAQVIDLGCNTLRLEHLDQAKGKVRTNDGRAGVIITNQLGYELIRRAYYLAGEMADTEMVAVPDPVHGTRMQQVTKFDGWIIYVNDRQPTGTCDGPVGYGVAPYGPSPYGSGTVTKVNTNIWFAVLGWDHLHGIVPDSLGESMFVERKTIRPENSKLVGHLTWPVGIALGSPSALAVVKNATM